MLEADVVLEKDSWNEMSSYGEKWTGIDDDERKKFGESYSQR